MYQSETRFFFGESREIERPLLQNIFESVFDTRLLLWM